MIVNMNKYKHTVTATALLPWYLSFFPLYYCIKATHYRGNYRGYRSIPAVVVTVSLSGVYRFLSLACFDALNKSDVIL